MVLAHPEYLDEIEKLVKGEKYKEFTVFLTEKFMLMVENFQTNAVTLNKDLIKQSELKQISVGEMMNSTANKGSGKSNKIFLHESYF